MSVNNNNRKITQLPSVSQSAMTDSDIFVFVHSGTTSQGTLGDIAGYVAGSTDTFSTGGTYNQSGATITIDNNMGNSFDITGITTTIKTGNILYVDNIYGNDSTGEKASLVNKYATIAGAESGATSGDTIMILTMQTNETMLGKDGVTYEFMAGAGITNTGKLTPNISDNVYPMFTDDGKGAINFTVIGGNFNGLLGLDSWTSNQGHACFYLREGGSITFDINNIYIEGNERGWCLWSQAGSSLVGNIRKDASAGNYFLGCLTRGSAQVTVGRDVYAGAIFLQAEEAEDVHIKVGNKITCGDSPITGFKYLMGVDGKNFFDPNPVDNVEGTNQVTVEAKAIVWKHEGATMESFYGIIYLFEMEDVAPDLHTAVFAKLKCEEFTVEGSGQASRNLLYTAFHRNTTKSVFRFDIGKMYINSDITFANTTFTVKDNVDIYFDNTSIEWNSTSVAGGATLIDITNSTWNFNNVRLKLNDNTIIPINGTNKDVAIYGGGFYTNGTLPTDLVNIVTEQPLSIDNTNVYDGLTNIM